MSLFSHFSLYELREIFEAYNKGLSLVLTSEYPWFRGMPSLQSPRVLAENAKVAEHVLERIRADGPRSTLGFEQERGSLRNWFGAPTNVVRAVLERLLPADVLAHEVPLEEQLRHKLLSRFRTHGLLAVGGRGDIFGLLGPAKPDAR